MGDVAFKDPCRAATTANIALSGLLNIDGISVAAGDRVLVKNQSTATTNGIYVVASGAWSRSTDFDGAGEVVGGTMVFVSSGTVNAYTIWRVDGFGPVTIGTTSISFVLGLESKSMSFLQSGTGTVARTVLDRLRDVVSVRDFGVLGVNTSDDVARLQTAIDSGKSLLFPAGTYYANNLMGSTTGQCFYGNNGRVDIVKNDDGTLLSHTGDYLEIHGIQFIGTGFSGDNVILEGNHCQAIFCSSYGTSGIPLWMKGSHARLHDTCGSYSTLDTTSTGFDVVIGSDGALTTYHQVVGLYTSQHTGGLKFIDAGGQAVIGGQFGKLTVVKGSGGYIAGSNGGQYAGCRINGDVFMSQSNSAFDAVLFDSSSCDFVFDTGTSLGAIGPTCSQPLTYTNNGISSGATANRNWAIGSSSSMGDITVTNVAAIGDVTFNNNKSILAKDLGGTARNIFNFSNGDDLFIGTGVQAGNFTLVNGGSVGTFIGVSGSSITQTTATTYIPVTTNAVSLGGASNRWSAGWITDLHTFPAASKTPTVNGEMVLELTSNTSLAVKVKGSDGIVRSVALTLT